MLSNQRVRKDSPPRTKINWLRDLYALEYGNLSQVNPVGKDLGKTQSLAKPRSSTGKMTIFSEEKGWKFKELEVTKEGLLQAVSRKGARRYKGMVKALQEGKVISFKDPVLPVWWGNESGKGDLFGSEEGQLPLDAKLQHLNPITGVWMLNLLRQRSELEFRQRWKIKSLSLEIQSIHTGTKYRDLCLTSLLPVV